MALTAPVYAEFPGRNGKIVYADGYRDLWAIDPDGSNEQNLTNYPGPGRFVAPDWSPDGTKIAFSDELDVFVMNADGSGRTNITAALPRPPDISYFFDSPSWSPDGTRIAFQRRFRECCGPVSPIAQVWVADPDGSNAARLETDTTSAARPVWHPNGARIGFLNGTEPWVVNLDGSGEVPLPAPDLSDWSPDGAKIAFTAPGAGFHENPDVFVQNVDGTGRVNLTNTLYPDSGPSWSPDGTQIVWSASSPWVMNADGSGIRRLSQNYGSQPDWQSIPVNAYVRPKGASPTQVSLVPAYEPCTAPNRTHGPPLAFDSCNPPGQTPGQLTVGTPDANGQPAKLRAHVRINPLRGNPATAADEADVRLRASVNDVRLRSDFSDYTGDLELRLALQITDRDNTPHPGGPGPATVEQFTHSQPLPCSTTPADATAGSTCQFDTTVEAVVPGAVKELTRGIWEFKRITVHDGAGNLFLTQGIFVP